MLQSIIELSKSSKEVDTNIYSIGDELRLKITNNGRAPFYFSVLEIMPDNTITALDISAGRFTIDELYLQVGQTYESEIMEVWYPLGIDMLKLIISDVPLDLSILERTDLRSLDTLNPIQKLLMTTQPSYINRGNTCLLYTSPSPRDRTRSRMPSSA